MRVLVLTLLSLLAVHETAAQSVLQNPDFDSDLSGWNLLAAAPNAVAWTSMDHASSSSSGSALLVHEAPCQVIGPGSYSCPGPSISQCAVAGPLRPFRVGVNGLIPAGPSQGGLIWVGVTYYAGSGCSGAALLFPFTGFRPVASWHALSIVFPSPAGTRSALIQVAAVRDSVPTGSFQAHVDAIVFEDAALAASEIPTQRPSLVALAILLAAGGVSRLSRAV